MFGVLSLVEEGFEFVRYEFGKVGADIAALHHPRSEQYQAMDAHSAMLLHCGAVFIVLIGAGAVGGRVGQECFQQLDIASRDGFAAVLLQEGAEIFDDCCVKLPPVAVLGYEKPAEQDLASRLILAFLV